MFSEGSSGITVVTGGVSSEVGGAGGVATGGGPGSYVIQGGYMLGGGNQNFSHNTRASPATVSMFVFIGGTGMNEASDSRPVFCVVHHTFVDKETWISA